MDKYVLRLTERELWYLREGFEASFTDPDALNETERKVSDKLDVLARKAYRDKTRKSA